MRLTLAKFYGGGPAYWLDPELDQVVLETAINLINHQAEKRDNADE